MTIGLCQQANRTADVYNENLIQRIMINLKSIVFVLFSFSLFSQSEGSNRNIEKHHNHHHHYKNLHHWEIPSQDPDRIILTFNGDPSTKRAVTWRTDSSVLSAKAQIALAGPNKNFVTDASSYHAITEVFDLGAYKSNNSFDVHYHTVIF